MNAEQVLLTIKGSFKGIDADFVSVLIKFPLPNQQEVFCTIETIQNDRFYTLIFQYEIEFLLFSLTCNLILPKQVTEGSILITIQPERILLTGDTDISGRIEFPEKFKVYVSVLN